MKSSIKALVFLGLLLLPFNLVLAQGKGKKEETPKPEVKESWTDKFESGYDKGFYIKTKDEKFKLNISSYAQFMYEFHHFDDPAGDDSNTFRVRRARLTFSGNIFTKKLGYKFQLDLTKPALLDAFFDYKAFGDALIIRAGQYTIPMNRQQIISSSKQQFNDRSLASAEFIPGVEIDANKDGTVEKTNKDGRDIGLMVHGKVLKKKLDYQVAAMNAAGINTTNVNNEFLYAARASYNILGDYGYSESDIERSDDPAVFVGGHGIYNVGEVTQDKILQGGFESGMKWKGLSLQGEFMVRNTNKMTATDKRDYGYYAQAGYFLIPKKFEVAARASQIFFEGARNDKAEFSLGLNYFIFKQNVKLQSDYSWLPDNTATGVENNHRVRLKLQTAF